MSVEGIPLVNRDLYSDTYFEDPGRSLGNQTQAYGRIEDTISPFHRAVFVFMLRAGLLLIQLGSIPVKDTTIILLHNVFEFSTSTIAYLMVGHIFAYGNDAGQLIGRDRWIGSHDANMENVVSGWSAVVTSTGILTTMVAGRVHLLGLVVVVVVMAAFVDPLTIHWIWTSMGFMHNYEIRDEIVSYRDTGGCAIVHIFAGSIAMITVFALGRRLLRLKDISESSLPPSSPATCFLGYFLLIIGLLSMSLPNISYEDNRVPDNYVGRILVNNIAAMTGGMLIVCLIQLAMEKKNFHYWSMVRAIQGAIAAMVMISAGGDAYSPIVALLLGLAAGTIFYFLARVLFSSSIEDYCNIIPIHFVCGIIGSLTPPIFGEIPGFAFDTHSTLKVVVLNLCWQMICDGILLCVFFGVFIPIVLLLYCVGFVHNSSDEVDHTRAQTVLDRGPDRSLLQRLLKPGEPPRLIKPGNEGKSEGRLRGLDDLSSKLDMSYFDPKTMRGTSGYYTAPISEGGGRRNPPTIQTYRVELDVRTPPLDEFCPRSSLEEGDYARGHSKNDGLKDSGATGRMSYSGNSVDVQNVPYGEGVDSSSHPPNDLSSQRGDNWQNKTQPNATRSLDGSPNVHDTGQTFTEAQREPDRKPLHRPHIPTRSLQDVPYRDDYDKTQGRNAISECKIQIDEDFQLGGNESNAESFQTVYKRGSTERTHSEDNTDCVADQHTYHEQLLNTTSSDNVHNLYGLDNLPLEDEIHSQTSLVQRAYNIGQQHRMKTCRYLPYTLYANSQDIFCERPGIERGSYVQERGINLIGPCGTENYGGFQEEPRTTLGTEQEARVGAPITKCLGDGVVGGAAAMPGDSLRGDESSVNVYSLRDNAAECGDQSVTPRAWEGDDAGRMSLSVVSHKFGETREEFVDSRGEEFGVSSATRFGEAREEFVESRGKEFGVSSATRFGETREEFVEYRGEEFGVSSATRFGETREEFVDAPGEEFGVSSATRFGETREEFVDSRGEEFGVTSAARGGETTAECDVGFSSLHNGEGSDSSGEHDKRSGSYHSVSSDDNTPTPVPGTGVMESPSDGNTGTREDTSYYGVNDELRPSPSRPCFSHNQVAVRQVSPCDVDAKRDIMIMKGNVEVSIDTDVPTRRVETPRADTSQHCRPLRIERDRNKDVVIVVDVEEERANEDQYNNLNRWYNE